MKVSTKGRYGLRVMLELALRYEKNLLTAREIAEQQQISEKYIEQIIGGLTKAGLVKSHRGANGGYRMAEPPGDVTVGQILRITEGGLNIVDCDKETSEQKTKREQNVTNVVWMEIENAIEEVVDNITMADLVARHNEVFSFAYMI